MKICGKANNKSSVFTKLIAVVLFTCQFANSRDGTEIVGWVIKELVVEASVNGFKERMERAQVMEVAKIDFPSIKVAGLCLENILMKEMNDRDITEAVNKLAEKTTLGSKWSDFEDHAYKHKFKLMFDQAVKLTLPSYLWCVTCLTSVTSLTSEAWEVGWKVGGEMARKGIKKFGKKVGHGGIEDRYVDESAIEQMKKTIKEVDYKERISKEIESVAQKLERNPSRVKEMQNMLFEVGLTGRTPEIILRDNQWEVKGHGCALM